jgi:hypothetical protein
METDLLARVPEWEREADVFEEKARALRQMAEAVRVLNGDAARLFALPAPTAAVNQYATGRGPRGREAVRAIVSERPGRWFVRDIKQINRQRRWPSDDAGIETAVIRMAKAGEAKRIAGRRGYYDFGALAPTGPTHNHDRQTSQEGVG